VPDEVTEQQDAADLHRRLAALEEERAESIAQAHAALAAAQDRSYWLDRWGLDLNAAMRRPGAVYLRLGLRALRLTLRAATEVRLFARALPTKWRRMRVNAEETGQESSAGAAETPPEGSLARTRLPDPLRGSPVTDELFERLSDADVQEIERRAGSDLPSGSWGADRRRYLLSLGVHHEVPAVSQKTGLTISMPPDDVHSMARGALAAGGSPYYADLVADGFAAAGAPIERGMRCLDFGSSSGRTVRVLAPAYPDCQWHGCDPIEDAIEWAQAHIAGVEFVLSPEAPPVPYEDESFDRVFAISIWSHFSAAAATAWLKEMQRIVKPGGALLLTTHGFNTVAHDHHSHRRTEAQLREVRAGLYDEGHWFLDEFGAAGDHGVANPDWGTAFLTPEWLLARVFPGWYVGAFALGRVEENQDMYVLRRR